MEEILFILSFPMEISSYFQVVIADL